jgi:hypothetical protein
MAHREHEPAAGPQHPAHLAEHRERIGHERQRPERGAGQVEGGLRERHRLGVGLHHGHVQPRVEIDALRVAQLAVRDVERRHVGPLRHQPPRALRRTAADLQHPPPAHLAEEVRGGLVHAFRAPHEPAVTQELPVLGLVVVGVAVPPAAVGAGGAGRH